MLGSRMSGEVWDQPFGVVLNHFSKTNVPHLRASLLFAASLSLQDPLVLELLVVDGSAERDEWLCGEIERLGGRYHHEGHVLSFAEGYNIGARMITAPWIVLSASDVYPALDFFQSAFSLIQRGSSEIGCIIPRLTVSDLPIQESNQSPMSICVVPLMTLNLNVFERETFFEIGQVPECYSGAFNDVEMCIRIHDSKKLIVMLPTKCVHYGRLTLSAGSNYRYPPDRDVFFSRFPHLAKIGYFWDVDIARICGGRVGVLLRIAGALTPRRKRLAVLHRILRAMPLMTRWKPVPELLEKS